MKILLAFFLVFSLGCQSSKISVVREGYPAIELSCKNIGDTQLEIDYNDIRITCYGGKLSEQASRLVQDVVSTAISAILPMNAIGGAADYIFGAGKEEQP